jgi:23S rRNA pseudouridine1911/1915/1917 synthase
VAALDAAIAIFKTRRVIKLYQAIVWGAFKQSVSTLTEELDGERAVSHVTREAMSKDATFLKVRIETGRTHQIRVHLNALSRHILGDSLYGFKSQNGTIPRVMLHAYILYLKHPRTGQLLQINAPLWDDFNTYLTHHFTKEEVNEKITLDSIVNGFGSHDRWVYKNT